MIELKNMLLSLNIMLISFEEIYNFILLNNIPITGILHIGAHDCEEKYAYNRHGIDDSKIIWIEGNESLVEKIKGRGIPNVYYALVDNEEKDVEFKITSNGQSSSILDLGLHATLYPDVVVTETRKQRTIRLDTLFEQNNIDPSKYNFWNLDIQGTELRAIQSGERFLKFVNYIYVEVNTKEIYSGCPLLNDIDDYLAKHGFGRISYKEYDTGHGWGDAFYIRVA